MGKLQLARHLDRHRVASVSGPMLLGCESPLEYSGEVRVEDLFQFTAEVPKSLQWSVNLVLFYICEAPDLPPRFQLPEPLPLHSTKRLKLAHPGKMRRTWPLAQLARFSCKPPSQRPGLSRSKVKSRRSHAPDFPSQMTPVWPFLTTTD